MVEEAPEGGRGARIAMRCVWILLLVFVRARTLPQQRQFIILKFCCRLQEVAHWPEDGPEERLAASVNCLFLSYLILSFVALIMLSIHTYYSCV